MTLQPGEDLIVGNRLRQILNKARKQSASAWFRQDEWRRNSPRVTPLSPLHHAHTLLDLFNDLSRSERRIPDTDAYASLAKLALQLGDPNCTAIFVPDKNIMMPNDGTAE
jgi:hypothetical protein